MLCLVISQNRQRTTGPSRWVENGSLEGYFMLRKSSKLHGAKIIYYWWGDTPGVLTEVKMWTNGISTASRWHQKIFSEVFTHRHFLLCLQVLSEEILLENNFCHIIAAAAAAKSLQLCPTLCDQIDGSPPGFLSLGFSRQEHWSGLPFPSPMHESEKWKWSRLVVSDSSDPMDCSLPGSSIHGIFQARALEWGAIAFSMPDHYLTIIKDFHVNKDVCVY